MVQVSNVMYTFIDKKKVSNVLARLPIDLIIKYMGSKLEKPLKKKKIKLIVDHFALAVIGLCYFFFPHEAINILTYIHYYNASSIMNY